MSEDDLKQDKRSNDAHTRIMFGVPKLVAAIDARERALRDASSPVLGACEQVPSHMLKTTRAPVEGLLDKLSSSRGVEATARLHASAKPALGARFGKHRKLILIGGVLFVVALALSSGVSGSRGAHTNARAAAAPESSTAPRKSDKAEVAALRSQRLPPNTAGVKQSSHRVKKQSELSLPTPSTDKATVSARDAAASLAAGDIERAAKLYAQLAVLQPEVTAYAAAAHILAERMPPPTRDEGLPRAESRN